MLSTSVAANPPEEVVMVEDRDAGLSGVIVLDSRTLGPAAGGCRMWSYASQQESFTDAIRLARGMTYKNALAGLPLGGGKAVLQRPDGVFDRRRFFEAFGKAVERLDGRYVTAEDVGTTVRDMQAVSQHTRHVAGLPPHRKRPGGDPSPHTARGVLAAMAVIAERKLHRPLGGCTVAIQGVGHVGYALAKLLHAHSAKLVVAERDSRLAAKVAVETGAELVPLDAIYAARADIFAPCALGATLNAKTVGQLKAKLVCGAANNQLATDDDAELLRDRDILYAPDFVVNAGGIVNVAGEYLGLGASEVRLRVAETGERLGQVLDHAERLGLLPHQAAEALARERITAQSSKHVLCYAA